jgi:hypothetical protein
LTKTSQHVTSTQQQPTICFDIEATTFILHTSHASNHPAIALPHTMDEASRLVSELQQKLSDLDHKVWQYRRDMASEFTKYAENVLRDVPENVSETVSKAVAESIKGCKSLNPDGLLSIESWATGSGSLANRVENGAPSYFFNSTPTIPYQRDDQEVESPRSPHEREKEFQGLFTPSYLPLLDSTTRNERRSSYEPQSSPSMDTDYKCKEREMEPSRADASTDTRSLAPSPEVRRPATPKRKNTDEWSVASDVSDGPVRRSALRRSSSACKVTSPRRVRFDVAGEEVLPTASPIQGQSILAEDDAPTFFDTNSDEEAGDEQVEDIDDQPPKRISSSQALRALSRGPLEDDGTQWTTVSAPPDGSASVPAVSGLAQGDSEEDLYFRAKKPSVHFEAHTEPLAISEKAALDTTAATTPHNSGANLNDSETPSDDEMLGMPPLKSMKGQKSAISLSPLSPLNTDIESSTSPTLLPSKPSVALHDFISKQADLGEEFQFLDEQEEMFRFDDTNEINDRRSPPEEEHVDTDSDSPASPVAAREPMSISEFSRSPAREIPKPAPSKPSSPPAKGVIGSYKGRPFSMPIVSDEIHAQAASLGAMNSFVGSVNGRSGVDESDIQSFRASGVVGSFSGTPRSMSERMMMEDLLEADEGRQNDINGS